MTTTLQRMDPAFADLPTECLEHSPWPAGEELDLLAEDDSPGRYLLVRAGSERERVALTGEVIHLGRGLTADVRLDDHLVSRRHAIILLRGRQAWLVDDRSANGVVLNGRVVQEAELHHGDVILLGRSVLRYLDF